MEYTFEQALKKLEEISEILSNNDISLEESIQLYSQGVELLAFCNDKLNNASFKIQEIENSLKEN